ncbi:hypothetical protein [Nostoc sp.]|uniref:hypothetical protein n=1 Tax=Nostoc sp. TaxID=1180 RepID=UPI002FFAF2D7
MGHLPSFDFPIAYECDRFLWQKQRHRKGAASADIPINKPIPEKLSSQIDAGVKLAMKKAIERHRRLVESISIWQNGQVVRLTAIQIPPLNSDE